MTRVYSQANSVRSEYKKSANAIVHQGLVTMGSLTVSQAVQAQVKADIRSATARNHSSTHLLHTALFRTGAGWSM